MARFIGYLSGGRRVVSRLGHSTMGLNVKAQTWNAGIAVHLYVNHMGHDCVQIIAYPVNNDAGREQVIYDGPISTLAVHGRDAVVSGLSVSTDKCTSVTEDQS